MNYEDIDYGDIEEDYIIGDFNKPTYEELQNKIDKAIEYMQEHRETLISIMGTYYYKLLEKLGGKDE